MANVHEHQYIIKDIVLISHDGKEYSLDQQFIEFSFEETIFETTVHGRIQVVESVDYPSQLPMIGEERIRISFTRIDELTGDEIDPIKFELPVYTLYGKMQEGGSAKRQTYSLNYCSESIYKNLNSIVSKSFKGVTYSQMVQEVYDNYLKHEKPIVVEPTEGLKNFVVHNKRPMKTILDICKLSASAEGNGLFYVFYEDRDQFNFVTMKKLMAQEPLRTIYSGIKNLPVSGNSDYSSGSKNITRDMYSASKVHEASGGFDILNSALTGEGSSSLMTIDPIRRTFSFKTLDLRGSGLAGEIQKAIDSPISLEFAPDSDLAAIASAVAPKTWTKNTKMFVNPRSAMKLVIGDSGQNTQEYIAQRDPSVNSYSPEEFYLQREAEKQLFLKNITSVSLPGDPRIKAGVVLNFALPERTGFISEKNLPELDKYLQGNYVVVGVAHIVSRGKYKMHLELMKNTIHSEIRAVDLFDKVKNLFG
jgi:hypothetical protein